MSIEINLHENYVSWQLGIAEKEITIITQLTYF